MKTRRLFISCALVTVSLVTAGYAQSDTSTRAMPSPTSAGHLVVGVVQAIEAESRSLTIAHQPITAMGMPAMTMAFRADPSVNIASVKPGDAIAFVLSPSAAGGVSITSLQTIAGGEAVSQAPMEGMQGMPHAAGKNMMQECHEMMMRR